MVTPFAGVWIEIKTGLAALLLLPVTPFAGVWIEIDGEASQTGTVRVTPFAGVWIEIRAEITNITTKVTSLPSRECGLKSVERKN